MGLGDLWPWGKELSSRESNKSKRRQEILTAARALMREPGGVAFSMRALAEAAGVSVATPYNLFGSKQAVLVAVLDQDLAAYQADLDALQADGCETLFQAIDVTAKLFAEDPALYQNLLGAALIEGGRELRWLFSGPRYALWKRLLAEAVSAGELDPSGDPDAFALTLSQLLFASIQEWALGLLSLEEMVARMRYGLALTLSAKATEASRRNLMNRLRSAEEALQKLWRAHLAERLEAGTLDEDTRALLADQLRHLETTT